MDPLAVPPIELAAALAGAAAIAMLARRRNLLDPSGTAAATLLGPALVATGGWWLGALLIAFFLTSSLLPSVDTDGPARTARQVLANGGPALAFASLALAVDWPALLTGAAATLAGAAADTWGTEIGRRFGGIPVSIRTGRRVPPGTSGAISGLGTAASVAGALLIAALAWLLAPLGPDWLSIGMVPAMAIAAGGIVGSATDTMLGATAQARFRCERCGHVTETAANHAPGHPVRHSDGVRWLTNGIVNLVATGMAGCAAMAVEGLMG